MKHGRRPCSCIAALCCTAPQRRLGTYGRRSNDQYTTLGQAVANTRSPSRSPFLALRVDVLSMLFHRSIFFFGPPLVFWASSLGARSLFFFNRKGSQLWKGVCLAGRAHPLILIPLAPTRFKATGFQVSPVFFAFACLLLVLSVGCLGPPLSPPGRRGV